MPINVMWAMFPSGAMLSSVKQSLTKLVKEKELQVIYAQANVGKIEEMNTCNSENVRVLPLSNVGQQKRRYWFRWNVRDS